jgi:hypothetical protein
MSVCKARTARYEHGPPGGGPTLPHNRFYKRIMKGCPSRCSLELLENQITARRNTL